MPGHDVKPATGTSKHKVLSLLALHFRSTQERIYLHPRSQVQVQVGGGRGVVDEGDKREEGEDGKGQEGRTRGGGDRKGAPLLVQW